MTPDDVAAASQVGRDALNALYPVEFQPSSDEERERHRIRSEGRIAHLLRTDPEGAWVAEAHDGEVVGLALALVREDVWGLSLFAVKNGLQGQGIGGPLLAGALRWAEGRRGAMILSSTDPRALRRYFRAGFAIRPCLAAAGQINRARIPAGLTARAGDVEDDAELIAAVSRHVRTASHAEDVGEMVRTGGRLLVVDGRGWAVAREGSPMLVAARDDEAAADLLWSCFAAGAPGESVHVDFIGQGNDWAVAVALDMGLSLTPDGPIFARGDVGPLAPYLPSGAYL
ncbi:MAG TPA: GNAT family N-acetyltransferase [Baekduia sp.]